MNGSVYEGRFSNDKRHGHGIFRLSGGGVYEGEYKNNKQHGYGIMRYRSFCFLSFAQYLMCTVWPAEISIVLLVLYTIFSYF